jgi:hypothetical protein
LRFKRKSLTEKKYKIKQMKAKLTMGHRKSQKKIVQIVKKQVKIAAEDGIAVEDGALQNIINQWKINGEKKV